MPREPIRVYADTSVFGGVLDEQFEEPSKALFDQVRKGRFELIISPLVQAELVGAPAEARRLLQEMLAVAERVMVTDEALRLHAAYVQARILAPRRAADALHVALATVAGCGVIVSWNFRHIVHLDKIRLYNAANILQGYNEIAICSPLEVIEYEDQDI